MLGGSMSADTDSQSGSERRIYPRVPLDAPYFVTLRRDDGVEVPALVVDLGCGGIQAALPPGSSENLRTWLSHQVVVAGLPEPVQCDGFGYTGAITWVSAERCGVRFLSPLAVSDEELETLIRSL